MSPLTTAAFIAVMGVALVSDIRTHRIPNALIGAGLVVALALEGAAGFGALSAALLGAALAFLVAFPLFALGAIGGGDAKLFLVVGAFMGPAGFFYALLASAIAGGVLAVAVSARRGVILPMLLGCKDLVVHTVTFGRSGARPSFEDPGAVTVPYGVAIAVGSVATWFLLPRVF